MMHSSTNGRRAVDRHTRTSLVLLEVANMIPAVVNMKKKCNEPKKKKKAILNLKHVVSTADIDNVILLRTNV